MYSGSVNLVFNILSFTDIQDCIVTGAYLSQLLDKGYFEYYLNRIFEYNYGVVLPLG